MEFLELNWNKSHILKTNTKFICTSDDKSIKAEEIKRDLEPWLSAIFQSEHLSLLIGTGLTSAIATFAGITSSGMARLQLNSKYKDQISAYSDDSAKTMNRGEANFEDDVRVALNLLEGMKIVKSGCSDSLEKDLNHQLIKFIKNILKTEEDFFIKLKIGDPEMITAFNLLKNFILSFTSRTATRERLNIFTTNYDRFIELACDETGILLLDRFKGKIQPVFRNTRLELDYHYNPPGIRGEPRYVEGVARFTKLHGSIDWKFENDRVVRTLLPFGAKEDHPEIPENIIEKVVIFPNASKDIETAFYPYAELFRDFSSAICQPNSVIITYGYGFGDTHINRVIDDMLTIPSTHLVIISWDEKIIKEDESVHYGASRERIIKFLENKNSAQCTLLIGEHFGNIKNLVEYYLPKSAIDRLTIKMQKLKDNRGDKESQTSIQKEDFDE